MMRRGCLVLVLACVASASPHAAAAGSPQLVFSEGSGLFTVGADGKGLRAIPVDTTYDVSNAAWAASGRILYLRRSAAGFDGADRLLESWEIRAVDPLSRKDSRVMRQRLCCQWLAPVEAAGQWLDPPAWSPDGKRVAFTRWSCVNSFVWGLGCLWHSQIVVVDADGTDLEPLAGAVYGSDPQWSPDGKKIAFTRVGTVEVVDSKDGRPLAVLRAIGSAAGSPRWSPDGKRIGFLGQRVDGLLVRAPDVWVAKADGTSARALPVRSSTPPSWSPDSRYLAYAESTAGSQRATQRAIATIRWDGRGRRLLTTLADSEVWGPQWSPDGSRIAFLRSQATPARWEPRNGIWSIDPRTGSGLKRVRAFADEWATFAWKPG